MHEIEQEGSHSTHQKDEILDYRFGKIGSRIDIIEETLEDLMDIELKQLLEGFITFQNTWVDSLATMHKRLERIEQWMLTKEGQESPLSKTPTTDTKSAILLEPSSQ